MSAIYPLAREGYLRGEISWNVDTLVTHILDSTYAYDATHQYVSDLTGIIATSAAMTGITTTLGVADANDVTFPGVVPGPEIKHVVVSTDTGVPSTSRLIVYYNSDTASTEIALEPDGSDVRVRWSNGALRIFRL